MAPKLFRERLLQIAVFVFRRIEDHLFSAGSILIETAALHVLKLDHQEPRLGPFAFLVKADFSDDGVESVVVNIGGELAVIETAGRLHRLFEHLHGGVSEWRLIETERI